MKCKMEFYNPVQIFVFDAKNHQELLDNFLALNKGFHFGEIKRYGDVTKCDVFDWKTKNKFGCFMGCDLAQISRFFVSVLLHSQLSF